MTDESEGRVWQSLGPWLAGGGGASIVAAVAYLLKTWHRDAVQAYKDQAAAWERIATMHEHRADLREQQLGQVLGRASETV
jgi:uncharacterized protein YukE